MREVATLVTARVWRPASLALRRAASVSAVSPDCEMTTIDGGVGPGIVGAVDVFAGVFDVDGKAAQLFDRQLGDHAGVAA